MAFFDHRRPTNSSNSGTYQNRNMASHYNSAGGSGGGVSSSLCSPFLSFSSMSPTCVADIATGSIIQGGIFAGGGGSHSQSHTRAINHSAAFGVPRSYTDHSRMQPPRRHQHEARIPATKAEFEGGTSSTGSVAWPPLENKIARQNHVHTAPAFTQEHLICGVAPPVSASTSKALNLIHEGASWNAAGSLNSKPKFEMCKFVLQGKACPFKNAKNNGKRCAFAHSDKEMVRDYAILVAYGRVEDVLLDRNLPCMEALTTGTCPFGDHTGSGPSRCTRLHDPRWMAANNDKNLLQDASPLPCNSLNKNNQAYSHQHHQAGAAWLQHREMPCTKFVMQNQNRTDIPVNSAYHLMRDAMYEGGQLMRVEDAHEQQERDHQEMLSRDSNVLFFVAVNSKQGHKNGGIAGSAGEAFVAVQSFNSISNDSSGIAHNNRLIPELSALEIAVDMHHNPANPEEKIFTYQPSHVLEGQPCMVLASSWFVVQGVRHIVHKIAFGPAAKDLTSGGRKIPPVALWFDLTSAELIANAHQAKENHKAWGGEKLSPQAAKLLSGKLGIVEHYHYDTHVSQLHVDLMVLRLRQLQNLECGSIKKTQEQWLLERQSLKLQFKAVQAKLECSIKRFHEMSSVSLCQDRSRRNPSADRGAGTVALNRPDCSKHVVCKTKTLRGQKNVNHFLQSFEATMGNVVSVPPPPAWQHAPRQQHTNNSGVISHGCGALSSLVHQTAAFRGSIGSAKLPTLHQARNTSFAAAVTATSDSAWESWRRTILHPEYEHLLRQHQNKHIHHQHHHNNATAAHSHHHSPRPTNYGARRATANVTGSSMIYKSSNNHHQPGAIAA